MKHITRLLLALGFALALVAPARASLGQVTTLNTTTVKTIVLAGPHAWYVIIQNLGANAVNITTDGGSTYTDITGRHGTDPTAGATGLGYVIPAASNGVPGAVYISAQPNTGLIPPIRAIMQTGTTTLNIITSDTQSTFPTS